VLEAVADDGNGGGLIEMERAGRDATCCGTSGFVHCDAHSRRMQAERLASATATGATKLVTACPKCLIHFSCAQSENRLRGRPRAPIEIEDLTIVAAARLKVADSPESTIAQTGEAT
jgi:Fe-S oxidoreductase